MRKLICTLLIFAMIMCLNACGVSQTTPSPLETTVATETAPLPTEETIVETSEGEGGQ